MEKDPKISKFLIYFMKELALYEGFYLVKFSTLGNYFKEINGGEFSKQLKDMEDDYDKLKPIKGFDGDLPEFLKNLSKMRKDLTHYIEKVKESDITIEKFKYLVNIILHFRKLEDKIHLIKRGVQEADKLRKGIDNMKEIYYNEMDDFLRDLIDFNFDTFNFNNLIEFENINFYSFIFNQFENFLFKVFRFVLMKRPEILKKKSIGLNQLNMIVIKDILNIDLINEAVIEKILHDLFYKNYEEIIKYANNPLGLNIKIEEKDISMLNGYKQIKNLYSHGEGIVNTIFLKKFQAFKIDFIDLGLNKSSLGDKLQINMKLINELKKLLFKVCSILNKSLVSKYPEIIANP